MLKKTLLVTTALHVASAFYAYADGNESGLLQRGNNNKATVVQSGSNNIAGKSVGNLRSGQEQDYNDLSIEQSGDNNKIGHVVEQIGASDLLLTAEGIKQHGGRNKLVITQANSNEILSIQQQKGTNASATANQMIIDQSSDFNKIRQVYQRYQKQANTPDAPVAPNDLTISQSGGDANNIGILFQVGSNLSQSISQVGASNHIGVVHQGERIQINPERIFAPLNDSDVDIDQQGDYNTIKSVKQIKANRAVLDILQSGDNNLINTVNQTGDISTLVLTQAGDRNKINSTTQTGGLNDASITQTGNDNLVEEISQTGGNNLLTVNITGNKNGSSAFARITLPSGLQAASIFQENTGLSNNQIGFSVTGSLNQFAFSQSGTGNSITGSIAKSGGLADSNEVAGLQRGDSNAASFNQGGSFNTALFTQVGNYNTTHLTQTGNSNFAEISQ